MNSLNKSKVSIIMNCHNGEKYLDEAIQSVLKQTYKNWEIIFWDNQSTDNSCKIIKSYKDQRIKYYYSEEYNKLGKARNLAIEKANGDLIAFLDCDDLWLPKKLELQLSVFNDPEVGIVISNSVFFNDKGKEKLLYKKKPSEGFVFKELLESYYISLETVIIRNSKLKLLSEYFDERFEVIEEFDLFIRLSKYCKLAYVNEILGKWRIHESSWTWKRKDLFPKETRIFIKKINKLIPETRTVYKSNIEKLYNNIICQEFLIAWEKNKYIHARENLKKIIFKSKKGLILYLLSFIIKYKTFNYLNAKRLLIK
tara:strand:+ start:1329 stop:2261 length:933 start_codon:yes stop_codon:yes gene_type:complete